ncbi:hypothetical protein C2G38_2037755 [Gigaspora rosea]|uniref:Uncharacterized protein n=1 Tax=Gigaspora rosea TaxID=44941 RepID=A0A397V5T9_9GLOM|nr:hypothetical protein C2G38_2037755 [Gigaspora rosea]
MNQNIKIPDLYIPNSIPVNPNSLANVQKGLEHIEMIAGIKSEQRNRFKIFARYQGYQTDNQLKYLEWAINQFNKAYKIKFEQTFTYLQAIINFVLELEQIDPYCEMQLDSNLLQFG